MFLRANIGVDYVDFFNLLHVVASRRLNQLPQLTTTSGDVDDAESDFDSTNSHLICDLFRLEKILEEMTQPATLDILHLGSSRLLSSPTSLHSRVHEAVVKSCKHLTCCL